MVPQGPQLVVTLSAGVQTRGITDRHATTTAVAAVITEAAATQEAATTTHETATTTHETAAAAKATKAAAPNNFATAVRGLVEGRLQVTTAGQLWILTISVVDEVDLG